MTQQQPRLDAGPTRDMTELRERRARSRRRTRLARLDLGIGVFAAIFLLIVSPGLAITGLVALLLLVGVFGSIFIQRRRTRRARAPEGERGKRRSARRTAR
jgi:hypothetical protein